MTYNDNFRLKEWVEYYKVYKEELYKHIIVDNGSSQEYIGQLHQCFPDSEIIELGYNGGCTSAYNAGIKRALEDTSCDAISLMANDIKFEKGEVTKLYRFLYSNDDFGMVFPLVHRPGLGPDRVNSYGNGIDKKRMTMIDLHHGCLVSDLASFEICETGPGGANMAKPSFYIVNGFQDENLFMYSDEVDTGLRARQNGIKMAVTKESVGWHLHKNPPISPDNRHPYRAYLVARNKTYLAQKHFGKKRKWSVGLYFVEDAIMSIIISLLRFKRDRAGIKYKRWQLIGAINGLMNNMKPNRFSHL